MTRSPASRIAVKEEELSALYEEQRQLQFIDELQGQKQKRTAFAAFIFGSNGKTCAIKSGEMQMTNTFLLAPTRKWGKRMNVYNQHRKGSGKVAAGTETEVDSTVSMIVDEENT